MPALLLNSPLVSMNFAEANRRTVARLEAHLQHKKISGAHDWQRGGK